MGMGDVNGGQVLLRLEDFRGQAMSFAQRELRVDDQHVLLARYHRGVDVVTVDASAGVYLYLELGLCANSGSERDRGKKRSCEHNEHYIPWKAGMLEPSR